MRESRFKRFAVLNRVLVVLMFVAFCSTRGAQAKMNVGTNLNSVNYFTTERPFIDVMKMSSGWITSDVSKNDWDSGQAAFIPVDSNGWPTQIPFAANFANHYVHVLIPAYANGDYTIKTVGKGSFKLSGGSSTSVFTPNGGNNTYTYNYSNANLGRGEPNYIYLDITQSQSGDALRNIQILLPGLGSSTETFYSVFKNRLAMYTTLRFMDWGNTNNSGATNWSDRATPSYYTQGSRGVSYEYMIQLCNETGKDMWVCIPHQANDNYVTQLATLIKNNLNSSRKVYIEYSNEVWNGQFSQGSWVGANIDGSGTDGSQFQKYGKRSRQIFDLFTGAFGGNTRLVRVLAGQAANTYILDQALIGAGDVCDALAIAPYFGKAIGPDDISGGIPSLDTLIGNETWSRTNESSNWTTAHKTLANNKGKRLICYEGGQHYTAYLGAENNQSLVDQLIALNRDSRMRDYYRNTYLPMVNNAGVDLFMHFSDVSQQTKFGSWGSMEYMDQTISPNNGDAVKYWAIQDWIANAPSGTPTPAPSGGPKYEAENATRSGGAAVNTNHTGYSGSGFVDKYETVGATTTFTVTANTTGSYNVILRYANAGGAARTLSIYVNGTRIRQTSFPTLANWDTWGDKTEALNLNSGSNTIALKYDSGDSGGVNLDYIYCDAAGGTGGGTPTPTPTPTPAPGGGPKYEAESAARSGGASIATDHTGYSGSGFVASYDIAGATTTFTVSANTTGSYNVNLRYANATGIARTISIYVNGTKIRQTSLPSLANWDTWGDKVEALSLNSGSNTIAYKYDSGDSGNVNLDYVYCDAASGTGGTSATKYEAESASSRNVGVNTNHTGYSGTGFVEGFGAANDYVTFTVNASSAGSKSVTLRYGNGSGAARTMSVYVNGTRIRQTSMPATANWDTWGNKAESLTLKSGSNTIMYRRDSADNGGLNIDYINVP